MAIKLPSLVGICGERFSGKTTAAEGFKAEGFAELTFAGPMKNIVQQMFLLTDEECADPKLKEKPGIMGVSYRRGMQVFGTDIVRSTLKEKLPELACDGDQFWIEHMRREVQRLNAKEVKVVVSDVRFVNEAEFILDAGGVLLFIERPDREDVAVARGWATRETIKDAHPSEAGVRAIFDKFVACDAPHLRASTVMNVSSKDAFQKAAVFAARLSNK